MAVITRHFSAEAISSGEAVDYYSCKQVPAFWHIIEA
ncbi:unnamed protein product, partial [marine sediment metagenome]